MSSVLKVSTHIYGVSKEIHGKSFIFQVNLGMWPLKLIVSGKTISVLKDFNTYLWVFQRDRWEIIHFTVKLGMWPLKSIISEKQALVLRVSTHMYGISKEIDRKLFIFQVNIGMWPLKLITSEKWALGWGFQHTLIEFLRRYMGNIHFSSKLRHVTPQIDRLRKTKLCSEGFNTYLLGFQRDRWENHSFFRVNLGMWPLKLIVSGQQTLFWGLQHIFMGFLRR